MAYSCRYRLDEQGTLLHARHGFDNMEMLRAWLSYTNALPNHAIFCFVP